MVYVSQAEDGIRDLTVTGVQTCALPISRRRRALLALRILLARGLLVSHERRPVGGEKRRQAAKVARQQLRHLLADAGNAQGVDEAMQLGLTRPLHIENQVLRRFLAHALE